MRRYAGPMIVLAAWMAAAAAAEKDPWARHTIDDTSRGADGVKLIDFNKDGLADIATGWEEGGVTRVYLHPGRKAVRKPWPAVTVGKTRSVEDADPADLDGDGMPDVISCCEGGTKCIYVHWAPKDAARLLDPAAWTQQAIPASKGKAKWMYARAMNVDDLNGPDVIAGGKGGGARIGWFALPANPRDVDKWVWHPVGPVGWVMSMRLIDMDSDGDRDVLLTDRYGAMAGVRWLENPGPQKATAAWKNHTIAAKGMQVMFMELGDLDRDGLGDIVIAVKGGRAKGRTKAAHVLWARRLDKSGVRWEEHAIAWPENAGSPKAAAVGDVNLDGKNDIVVTCEHAKGPRSGIFWLEYDKSPTEKKWTAHPISGPRGVKYDRAELIDIDGDGDLDVLCCEEAHGLGVFWHENPTK